MVEIHNTFLMGRIQCPIGSYIHILHKLETIWEFAKWLLSVQRHNKIIVDMLVPGPFISRNLITSELNSLN